MQNFKPQKSAETLDHAAYQSTIVKNLKSPKFAKLYCVKTSENGCVSAVVHMP